MDNMLAQSSSEKQTGKCFRLCTGVINGVSVTAQIVQRILHNYLYGWCPRKKKLASSSSKNVKIKLVK